jgi:hypothetical protein
MSYQRVPNATPRHSVQPRYFAERITCAAEISHRVLLARELPQSKALQRQDQPPFPLPPLPLSLPLPLLPLPLPLLGVCPVLPRRPGLHWLFFFSISHSTSSIFHHFSSIITL